MSARLLEWQRDCVLAEAALSAAGHTADAPRVQAAVELIEAVRWALDADRMAYTLDPLERAALRMRELGCL